MKKFTLSILALLVLSSGLEARAPKYVFLMFGDGMGINHITLTENYDAWKQGLNYQGERLNFRQFPYIGLCETQSANSCVTGSSEAATALFCGQKSNSGSLGINADGEPLESVMTRFHDRGYRIGVMSTDPVNHASPAASYAHNKSRGDFKNITKELPASGFEFFGGYSFIGFNDVEDGLNADDWLASKGYPTYYGVDEFNSRDKSLPHAILVHEKCRVRKSPITAEMDINKQYTLEDGTDEVSLAEMLDRCLDMLGDKKPFMVFCEEGNIDHAAHLNFPMALVSEVHKLESAVERALEFYRKHPTQTLIVVFSDHETGGLTYGRYGKWIDWETLENEWNSPRPKDSYKGAECTELSEKCNVLWTSHNHSGSPTPIFAIGCGAENFGRCIDNTDFSKILLQLK